MKKVVFGIVAALLVFGLVLAGCKSEDGDKDEQKFDGFTLEVKNLPEAGSGKIFGATLLASKTSDTPLAIGSPNYGMFLFYQPSTPGSYYPGDTPFTTAGTYVVAIALYNITAAQYETVYFYKEPVDYSSSKKAITVQWKDFTAQ